METGNPTPAPNPHPFHPDADNDPLIGTQEHPDQAAELRAEPEAEAAPWPTTGAPEKSRILAGVLGLFLGGLGIHRFYLAYFEVGLFQLATSLLTCGAVIAYGLHVRMPVPIMLLIAGSTVALIWIWGFAEGVMILAGMMPHDGHGHPLR